MNKLLLLFFIFLTVNSNGQIRYYNTEEAWSRLLYDTTPVDLNTIKSDSSIILISNRKKSEDTLRFMSEFPTEKKLSYFVVYSYRGKWHVKPMNDLQSAINLLPNKSKDWVVYTEGMGKLFTTDIFRGMNMAAQYNVNVIMLDYPSITSSKKTSGNYLFAVKNSKATYKYFSPVLKEIKTLRKLGNMGSGNISLFFHSMGNNFAKQMAKKGTVNSFNGTKWVNNIILNSACVSQSGHTSWLKKLNFGNNIYIHYNPEDFVLRSAHFVSKRKQLGEKVKMPISQTAYYINFNKIAGENHSNFLNIKNRITMPMETKEHYNILLHGKTIDFKSNPNYRKSTYKGIGWDLLPKKGSN